ncbi:MAG TPA: imidazole glycerol phosphate synthase subunit HisH [Rickettsiales bacterium]|nr:imidazole glycerol phosphate synthase subunit HisH [Rickettsiales bacterium]
MQVSIIDYGSGNLRSAAKAFECVAQSGQKIIVTNDPAQLAASSHIVLPGVGAFADCMNGLRNAAGMLEALEQEVIGKKKPFLGICVGMQMLFENGLEHGVHKGLGWLGGEVIRIDPNGHAANSAEQAPLKIPHMGWNDLIIKTPEHPLMEGIAPGDHAYFVHSYHAQCSNHKDIVATTQYGAELVAVVAKGNIMGTQFHPEKSQETGLRLIGNFLKMGSA